MDLLDRLRGYATAEPGTILPDELGGQWNWMPKLKQTLHEAIATIEELRAERDARYFNGMSSRANRLMSPDMDYSEIRAIALDHAGGIMERMVGKVTVEDLITAAQKVENYLRDASEAVAAHQESKRVTN